MGGDELQARLRRLGEAPVPTEVASAHLRAMGGVRARRWQFGWRAVAGAAFVGFLAGSTGLAAAGTLPAPAQDVAHDVLGTVGIHVPRSTEGCPEGATYRNHGEYVAAVAAAGGDVEAAAHSDCGKPVHGNKGKGKSGDAGEGTPRPDEDGDPCTGPPPWAGAQMTPEEKQAAVAERAAKCGTDETDADTPETDDEDGADTKVAPDTTQAPDTEHGPETEHERNTEHAPEKKPPKSTTTTVEDTTTTTESESSTTADG